MANIGRIFQTKFVKDDDNFKEQKKKQKFFVTGFSATFAIKILLNIDGLVEIVEISIYALNATRFH